MNNIKRLPALLMFAEVAQQQSFTAAAEKLGMSKSAVSQQIKKLEQELNQQLLSRHTRGMAITAAGQKLLNRCELLRDQVDLAFDELQHVKETPSGRFALTIPHSCEETIVIPALSQLCREYPLLEPEILVTDAPVDLIKNNLDIAIYGGTLKDSNYRARPIGAAQEIFCASPTYLQQKGQPKIPEQLAEHQLIAASWQNGTLNLYKNDHMDQQQTLTVKYAARTNTLPSALQMAEQDMGISLLPEFVIQPSLANGQLVRVLPEYHGQQWPFYMTHRFMGEKPIHIDRFYQLVEHFFMKVNNSL